MQFRLAGETGCGKVGRCATLEDSPNFLLSHNLDDGDNQFPTFDVELTFGKDSAIVIDRVLPANIYQGIAIVRTTQTTFLAEFLLKSLQSSVAQSVMARARGGAMNNISLYDIKRFDFPPPPLTEQNRIVAKVDELMALCDQLQARLTDGDDTRCLLDALIHEVLAPSEEESGNIISTIAR